MRSKLLYPLLLVLSAPALAQENYTPPPMFGAAPTAAPTQAPAPLQAPDATQQILEAPATSIAPGVSPKPSFRPRYSPSQKSAEQSAAAATPEQKYTGTNNPLLPPVITEGDPAHKKPSAPKKPKKTKAAKPPVPAAKPSVKAPVADAPVAPIVENPKTAPTPAPIAPQVDTPTKPAIEKKADHKSGKAMPAARVTSDGVVKGPKTMPSVPTTDVAAETTFQEEAPAGQTMMERHQKQRAAAVKAPPAPKQDAVEEAVEVTAAPMQPLSLAYERGISTANTDPSSFAGIAQALAANPGLRLMIEAYAAPTDEGENSDRRLALARALDVRKSLLSQGVPSNRIDIRALGQKTDKTPVDRVELTPYQPQKSAN